MTISATRSFLALMLATVSIGSGTATAAPTDCGKSGTRYGVTEYWTYWEYADEESVNGPGGTVTVTVKKTQTKTTSIAGKVGAEAKKVFAGISAEFSGQVTWSNTIEKGRSYTHEIAPDRYGHLRFRFLMHDVRWVRYIAYERCADEWTEQGSATVASKTDGHRFWETVDGLGPPPNDGRTHTGPRSSGPPVEA